MTNSDYNANGENHDNDEKTEDVKPAKPDETGASSSPPPRLKATCDLKTAFRPGQKNTFGTLHGDGPFGTCPGCTKTEGGCAYVAPGRKVSTCYVDGLARCRPNVAKNLLFNSKLLMTGDSAFRLSLLNAEFNRFEAEEKDPAKLFYRLHWAGDVFDEGYAKDLAAAMSAHPNVTFWGYTRTFKTDVSWYSEPRTDVVEALLAAKNAILFLSLDAVNFGMGIKVYNCLGGHARDNLRLCYMSKTDDLARKVSDLRETCEAADGKEYPWMSALNVVQCPVDTGNMKLKMACSNCRICLKRGGPAVWFRS